MQIKSRIKRPKSAKTRTMDNQAVEAKLEWMLDAVDRILSPANGMTVVDSTSPAPAWTDGEHIWLNRSALPPLREGLGDVELAIWLGANHHEMGHTLYSPRPSSTLIMEIKDLEKVGLYKGLRRVENIVEDQRQERLIIARFRAWRTYLTAAASFIVVEGLGGRMKPSIGEIWPWIVGRTWLPADVRAKSKAAWPGDGDELARLVGGYQKLADPGEDDSQDALQLLVDIRQCLIDGGEDLDNLPQGCGAGKPTEDLQGDTEPDSLTADDDVVPTAGSDEDNEQLAEGQEKAESDEDAGDGDPADGGDPGKGDGTDTGADPGDSGVPEAADEATDGTAPGKTPGAALPDGDLKDFVDALNDQVKDQINNDPEVSKQVNEAQASLEDMTAENRSELSTSDDVGAGATVKATPEAQHLGRSVGNALRRLTDLALPSWERRVDSGKLNVGRFMSRQIGDPFDTMFDRFAQGKQEEVSLDVTILVDTSQSMRNRGAHGLSTLAIQAAEGVFAIQKATDQAEGDCTVIGFGTDSYLISQTGEHPSPDEQNALTTNGGTDPTQAIKDTYIRLRSVEAYHKVVVVITDGEWHRGGDVMADLTESGVITVAVQLDPQMGGDPEYVKSRQRAKKMQADRMNCEYNITVEDCRDMVPLFEEVVVSEMEKAMESGGLR